jgi:hypothetical protein
MLQWIWMESKERQWVERTDLGDLFVVHLVVPRLYMLEEFYTPRSPQRMDALEQLFMVKSPLTKC